MRSLRLYRALSASTFIKRHTTPVSSQLSRSVVLLTQQRTLSDDAKAGGFAAVDKVEVTTVNNHQHQKLETQPETTRTRGDIDMMVDLNGDSFRGPLRFPISAEILCHLGEGKWVSGKIVAHYYRQKDWPANRRAPYQVEINEGGAKKTIYVPLDFDECVRTTLRFPLNARVECFLGDQLGWATGKVVKHYHREPSWNIADWAPYQIKLDEGQEKLPDGGGALIFAPLDDDSCVREASKWPWSS